MAQATSTDPSAHLVPESRSDIEAAATSARIANARDARNGKIALAVLATGFAGVIAVAATTTVNYVSTREFNEAAVQRTLAEEYDITVTDDEAYEIVFGEKAVTVTVDGEKVELRSYDARATGMARNSHPTFTMAVPLESR